MSGLADHTGDRAGRAAGPSRAARPPSDGRAAGRADAHHAADLDQPQRSRTGPVDAPRAAAFAVLQAVSEQDAYANLVLPRQLTEAGLTGRDAALATELGYGTLRATGTLDEVLRRCASRDLDDIQTPVLNLLRLGAYQLLRTRIPTHAAVATTVDLARATGHARAAGFVNAVLRKVSARDFDGWCDVIAGGASPLGRLAIRYSHPGWIVAAFADALAADTRHLPDQAADELPAALAADDHVPKPTWSAGPAGSASPTSPPRPAGEPGPYSPYAVRLSSGGEPGALTAVQQHRAGVQDEGSQLCALALAELPLTGPDERWLDLCAGPGWQGGAAGGAGRRRRRPADRPGAAPAPGRADRPGDRGLGRRDPGGRLPQRQPDERGYDRVLLDAPCTGLGALRRRPEARWRRSPATWPSCWLQAELLAAALRLVRPGGLVGYATCSPHLAETRRQIDRVLAGGSAELVDARPAFARVPGIGDSAMVQLWPHRHGTDAMFFAALRRLELVGGQPVVPGVRRSAAGKAAAHASGSTVIAVPPRLAGVPASAPEPMIAPSILSADFANLGAAAEAVSQARTGCTWT